MRRRVVDGGCDQVSGELSQSRSRLKPLPPTFHRPLLFCGSQIKGAVTQARQHTFPYDPMVDVFR
jgi:hypothetical protein